MRSLSLGVIFTSLFLVSCSLPGTSEESTSNTTLIKKDTFSMTVPSNWTESKKTDIPTPKQGKLALAYTAPESTKGFFNNLLVMEDELSGLISSKKYSEVNHLQTTRNYLEYTKLQEEALTFGDDDESILYVFEAKYNETTPRMKFIQTAKVCGKRVFLIHFSLTLDKVADPYKELVKSFTCK